MNITTIGLDIALMVTAGLIMMLSGGMPQTGPIQLPVHLTPKTIQSIHPYIAMQETSSSALITECLGG